MATKSLALAECLQQRLNFQLFRIWRAKEQTVQITAGGDNLVTNIG
jgi:hypothetical protein